MSGEAGGVIVGGMVALAVAPVIITGAAALGLAYGAIRLGGFLGKQALEYAAARKRENELKVVACSSQLENMYTQMRSVVREETDRHTRFAQEMGQYFSRMGADLQTMRAQGASVEELEKKLEISRKSMNAKLGEESAAFRSQIIAQGKAGLSQCVETIEKSNRERAELVRWADKSAAAQSMQRASAQDMLRDAEASCRLLQAMAESSKNSSFASQVQAVFATLQHSKTMMEQGMYQSAFSSARTVVRECAVLASEKVQNELEADMVAMELQARTEGLLEEMRAQRYVEFVDETKKVKKKVKADLCQFSQGKYKHMMETLETLSARLAAEGPTASAYEMQQIARRFDTELEPEARRIVDRSYKVMRGYYERLHVLEVVADFMTQQDYKMDWAMPVGGDASQKLVVHFVQKSTNNTISVTLDNDVDSGDIARMAMEILTFYGSGRPVTEAEKKQLREDLNAALAKAGLGGQLACQGKVNQPSDQVQMNSKEEVKKLNTKQVV